MKTSQLNADHRLKNLGFTPQSLGPVISYMKTVNGMWTIEAIVHQGRIIDMYLIEDGEIVYIIDSYSNFISILKGEITPIEFINQD